MASETQIIERESTKGNVIKIDILDQACGEFMIKDDDGNSVPIKSGDRINNEYYGAGTIIGVALTTDDISFFRNPVPAIKKALWISMDSNENGEVSPWLSTVDMKLI